MTYQRLIIPTKKKSYFLFGPRQTGKSTLVKSLLKKDDFYIDLLPHKNFIAYAKDPSRFREEILLHLKKYPKAIFVIDEIQKVPSLLDEVHELIESKKARFILTGSSARKLKRSGANLLAGRAYTYQLYPLTFQELGEDFNLDRALKVGTLPTLYENDQEDSVEFLRAYVSTYLKEEIQQEGLVRDIGSFGSFLDIVAANDGEITNFSSIARECAVTSNTVKGYFQILEDTFLVNKLSGWSRSVRKQLISHPRYYFFDCGVTNALTHQLNSELDPIVKGRRFEQLVINQIIAYCDYQRLDLQFYFWRTNHGAEVDLLIARGAKILCAIEIKSRKKIGAADLTGLKSFKEEHPTVPCFVLVNEQNERIVNNEFRLIDWKRFIEQEINVILG